MSFEKVTQRLISLGYTVSVFERASDATEYLAASLSGRNIGIGGSMTVKELGLFDRLRENNEVAWHLYPDEDMTADETIDKAKGAEIYISSVNALSEDGEMINIDGRCNRIAATLYGAKKTYLIIGKNKLAESFDAALHRARNVAAPKNAKRLNKKTPCAIKGDRCYNCNSPDRICRALTVFWTKPRGMDYEIILVNEELGY